MTITRSFGPIRVERARHLMRDGERESPPVAPWQTLPPIRLRWILQRPRCLSENSWTSLVRDSFGSLSCYRSSGSILSTWFFFLYFFFLQSNGWRSFLEFSLSPDQAWLTLLICTTPKKFTRWFLAATTLLLFPSLSVCPPFSLFLPFRKAG